MRILQPIGTPSPAVPLSEATPGRTVELKNPDGHPAYYKVCRATAAEPNITAVPGKCMLVNLETGRIVMKSEHLLVRLLSCAAKTHYHF